MYDQTLNGAKPTVKKLLKIKLHSSSPCPCSQRLFLKWGMFAGLCVFFHAAWIFPTSKGGVLRKIINGDTTTVRWE